MPVLMDPISHTETSKGCYIPSHGAQRETRRRKEVGAGDSMSFLQNGKKAWFIYQGESGAISEARE